MKTRRLNAHAGPGRTVLQRTSIDIARREFVKRSAGVGLLAGLPPLLSACGGGGGEEVTAPPPRTETRTLFFNLSHVGAAADSGQSIYVGGQWYPLTPSSAAPQVLAEARRNNALLATLADEHITHHAVGVTLPTDISAMGYIIGDLDPASGACSMSLQVQMLPSAALTHAYSRMRSLLGAGPLPLSAKREHYGLNAAASEQDLHDEFALLDASDHARTLVGAYPDLLCVEPNGAAHVHVSHILPNGGTRLLAGLLRSKGKATPEQSPGGVNAQGWATLRPVTLDDELTPVKNSRGVNVYQPDLDAAVASHAANAVLAVVQAVKDDTTLGADVTQVAPPSAPVAELSGKLWYRHDGAAGVRHGVLPGASDAPSWAFKHVNGAAGLMLKPVVTPVESGAVKVAIDQSNWFLRFLGIYVQFIDANGNAIATKDLPAGTIPGQSTPQKALDLSDTSFLGVLPPAYTLAGIPIGPGFSNSGFVIPPSAASVRFYLAGIGFNGTWSHPLDIKLFGLCLTVIVNWGLVLLFAAVGVSTLDSAIKKIVQIVAVICAEIVAVLSATFSFRDTPPTTEALLSLGDRVVQGFVNGAVAPLAKKALPRLIATVAEDITAATVTDASPIVGTTMRIFAAVVGAVTFAESLIEVGVSPATYEFDLVLTHDLGVTLLPDADNNQFPQVPAGYTLYFKLSYLFDNGSAHVLDAQDVPDPTVPSIPVTLKGLPRGGKVNIVVGFYARADDTPAGQNDWCAGNGSTGLFANIVDQAPPLRITQTKIAIDAGTHYVHTRKTALTAGATHQWIETTAAPAYVQPGGGQQLGDLGALRGITVRQGTALQQGYLGYAWQGYSSRLLDCSANAPGQLDVAANLNTSAASGGNAAENGYATTPCGLQGGATGGIKLAYDLLGNDAGNFYLDTSTLLVRRVRLDTPAFDAPGAGMAYGRLNLDSTAMLLHPAGHVVSINNANHKLEALRLPGAPLADADARTKLLAYAYAGEGSRAGLMRSPQAAAISPDGAILVLEDGSANNRIQAFDLGGNPLPFFGQQKTPYFLQLDATEGATYLDLAVEFTGYLYVLSRDNGLSFRLDIYHPGQTGTQPICTTRGVNAARLAVDLWRSVYTLNYEVLRLPGGTLPPLTEPSVSLWVPSLPPASS